MSGDPGRDFFLIYYYHYMFIIIIVIMCKSVRVCVCVCLVTQEACAACSVMRVPK